MNRLDSVTMRDLLPPNFQSDPDAIAASAAAAPDYHRLYSVAGQAVVLSNLGHLPEPWLDLLALDLHVDYYDTDLPIETKQELIRQSIPMHQKKGTPWAVEELIRIVFGGGRVEEWWEYGGEPYHFKAHVQFARFFDDAERRFVAALRSTKNVRSVLESIITESPPLTATLMLGGGLFGSISAHPVPGYPRPPADTIIKEESAR